MVASNASRFAIAALLASSLAMPVAEPKRGKISSKGGSDPPETSEPAPPATSDPPPPPTTSAPPPPPSSASPLPPSSSAPPPPSSTATNPDSTSVAAGPTSTSDSSVSSTSITGASSAPITTSGSVSSSGSITVSTSNTITSSASASFGSSSTSCSGSGSACLASSTTTSCSVSGSGSSACQSATKTLTWGPLRTLDGESNVSIAPGIYKESEVGDGNTDILGILGSLLSSNDTGSLFPNTTDLGSSIFRKRTEDTDNALNFKPNGVATPYKINPETYSDWDMVGPAQGGFYYNTQGAKMVDFKPGITKAPQSKDYLYVTEHVFEKQNLRDIIQLMTNGKTANGGTVAQADVTGIFDQAGIFNKDWDPNMQNKPNYGKKPLNTAFGCLGHTANNGAPTDMKNLQVLDKDVNAIKAIMSSFGNPAGNAFATKQPNDQVIFLTDWIDVFGYYKDADVTKSFNDAYKCLRDDFWPLFAQSPGAQQGYNYADAFETVTKDHLTKMQSQAQANFKKIIGPAATYWADQAKKNPQRQDIQNANNAVQDFKKNYQTYMVFPAGLTA